MRQRERRPWGWERAPVWKGREAPGFGRGAPEIVCAGCCSFYKPSSSEEDRCGGFTAAERLLEACREDGRSAGLEASVAGIADEGRRLTYAHDEVLRGAICAGCPFLADAGCDHRNPDLAPDRRLEPCGGYVLLAALLDCGFLTPEALARLGCRRGPAPAAPSHQDP